MADNTLSQASTPVETGTEATVMVRLTWCSYLLNGFAAVLGGAVLPQVMSDFQLTPSLGGLFIGLPAAGVVLAGLGGGALANRLGLKRLLALSLASLAASLAICGVAPAIPVLLLGALLFGVANGLVEMSGNALVTEMYRQRAAAELNRLHFFFGIGAFISPAFVAFLFSHHVPWRAAYLVTLAPAALLVLAYTRRPEVSRPAPVGLDLEAVWRTLKSPALRRVWLAAVCLLAAEQGITGWITTYMRRENILSPELASLGLAIFWLAMLAGRLINFRLPSRLRLRTIILVEVAGAAIFLWLTLCVHQPAAGLSALGLVGMFMAGLYPALMAQAGRQSVSSTGLVAGVFVAGVGAGKLLGPLVIGFVAERIDLALAMYLALFMLLSVALIFAPQQDGKGSEF